MISLRSYLIWNNKRACSWTNAVFVINSFIQLPAFQGNFSSDLWKGWNTFMIKCPIIQLCASTSKQLVIWRHFLSKYTKLNMRRLIRSIASVSSMPPDAYFFMQCQKNYPWSRWTTEMKTMFIHCTVSLSFRIVLRLMFVWWLCNNDWVILGLTPLWAKYLVNDSQLSKGRPKDIRCWESTYICNIMWTINTQESEW